MAMKKRRAPAPVPGFAVGYACVSSVEQMEGGRLHSSGRRLRGTRLLIGSCSWRSLRMAVCRRAFRSRNVQVVRALLRYLVAARLRSRRVSIARFAPRARDDRGAWTHGRSRRGAQAPADDSSEQATGSVLSSDGARG